MVADSGFMKDIKSDDTVYDRGPWKYDENTMSIVAVDGTVVATMGESFNDVGNARRIVASVNACSGFPLEALERAAEENLNG